MATITPGSSEYISEGLRAALRFDTERPTDGPIFSTFQTLQYLGILPADLDDPMKVESLAAAWTILDYFARPTVWTPDPVELVADLTPVTIPVAGLVQSFGLVRVEFSATFTSDGDPITGYVCNPAMAGVPAVGPYVGGLPAPGLGISTGLVLGGVIHLDLTDPPSAPITVELAAQTATPTDSVSCQFTCSVAPVQRGIFPA